MTNVEVLDVRPDARGGYRVDVGRGQRIGRVSSEWFSRPADERYLSLSELMASVKRRAERSRTRTIESAAVRVEADRDDAERLALVLPGSDQRSRPPIGASANSPCLSGRLRRTSASSRHRWLASISSTASPRTGPSRSRRSRPTTAGSNFAPSPARTMAGSTTTSWSRPCSGSRQRHG